MKFKTLIIAGLLAAFAVCLAACASGGSGQQGGNQQNGQQGNVPESGNVSLVTTQGEQFADDSAWIGTFQLCWNNLMDTINSGDPVEFDQGNSAQVDALNKKLFNEDMLSDDHYYTYAGKRTLSAKEEIEKAIAAKFDQKSDILDQFEWESSQDTDEWLMYAMLYRKFTFGQAFDEVRADNTAFGGDAHKNKAQGVKYFGCDGQSDETLRDQAFVMYYENADSHAVSLGTEQGDRVLLVKNPQGSTVAEMFENAMGKVRAFEGSTSVRAQDTLSVPELNIDELVEFKDLEGKTWTTPKGDEAKIEKALQTLKFSLDKSGGEVKSEAGIAVKATGLAPTEPEEAPRDFSYDDRFALFLIDEMAPVNEMSDFASQQPYMAVLVNDITKFQKDASAQ